MPRYVDWWAELARAQNIASVARLRTGTTKVQMDKAQAKVRQAQLELEAATEAWAVAEDARVKAEETVWALETRARGVQERVRAEHGKR